MTNLLDNIQSGIILKDDGENKVKYYNRAALDIIQIGDQTKGLDISSNEENVQSSRNIISSEYHLRVVEVR